MSVLVKHPSSTGVDGGCSPEAGRASTERYPRLQELLDSVQRTASAMLEAEEALRVVRERFERTQDAARQGELAVSALELVERQLELTRTRRRNLDGVEVELWSRRNSLERFLISARGVAWWRSHHRSL